VVKTTLLVSFSKPFLKTRNRIFVAILSEVSNSISISFILRIQKEINSQFNYLGDNFREVSPGPAGHPPGSRPTTIVYYLEEFWEFDWQHQPGRMSCRRKYAAITSNAIFTGINKLSRNSSIFQFSFSILY